MCNSVVFVALLCFILAKLELGWLGSGGLWLQQLRRVAVACDGGVQCDIFSWGPKSLAAPLILPSGLWIPQIAGGFGHFKEGQLVNSNKDQFDI